MRAKFKILTAICSAVILGGVSVLPALATSCDITYTPYVPVEKLNISTVITSKDLEQLPDNEASTIKEAIISKNSATSSWDWSQLSFSGITTSSATLSAKASSTLYTGTVNVQFTLPVVINISEVITDPNLEQIDDTETETIIAGIILKNSATADWEWDQLSFSGVSDTGATLSAKSSSVLYTGTVTLQFTLPEKINIETLITETVLGKINDNQEETIRDAIIAANETAADIDWQQIEISPITSTGAHVAAYAESKVYTGAVDVTFEIPDPTPITEIADIVVIKDLEEIEDMKVSTIRDAIIAFNPDTTIDIDWTQIVISSITTTGARVSATTESKDYSGLVDVTFTTPAPDPRTEISSIITELDLGEIADHDIETVKEAIILKNEAAGDMDWDQVDLSIGQDFAVIAANAFSELYIGGVMVEFTAPPGPVEPIKLDNIILNRQLNEIADIEFSTIQEAIIAENPLTTINFLWDEVEFTVVSPTWAELSAKEGSTIYAGKSFLEYTLPEPDDRTPLSDKIVYTDLGDIEDNEDETIKEAIYQANLTTCDDMQWSQLEYSEVTTTGALISAVPGAKNYTGSIRVTFNVVS